MTHRCISPLDWPVSWQRARAQSRSKFSSGTTWGVSTAAGTDHLLQELSRLKATEITLTCNARLNRGGGFDNTREPNDCGVAVYFRLNGDFKVLACDKWDRVGDNFHAIAKHIDALRGQIRWGVGSLEQAFGGYKALPAIGIKKP